MSKYILIISMILFSSMATSFDARAETATASDLITQEIAKDNKQNKEKSPNEVKAFIKTLPPLTYDEQKKARDLIKEADLSSDSCTPSDCYGKCMKDNYYTCCYKNKWCVGCQVCVGCQNGHDLCINIANPTQAAEMTSTYCAIKCAF